MRNPFDSLDPVGTKTTVKGTTERIRPLDYEERVVLVVEASVRTAGVKPSGDGPMWVQGLAAGDVFILDGERGSEVVNRLRLERRSAEDKAAGVEVLPGLEGATDASGVLITPGDDVELGEGGEESDDEESTEDGDGWEDAAPDAGPYPPPDFILDRLEDDLADEVYALLDEANKSEGHARREVLLQVEALVTEALNIRPGDRVIGESLYRDAAPDVWNSSIPFDGYERAKVADIKAFIDTVVAEYGPNAVAPDAGEGAEILAHVLDFERAHKARKGVLDHLSWLTEDTPESPALDDTTADEDEVDIGLEDDFGDEPDDELELGDDFEPTDDDGEEG